MKQIQILFLAANPVDTNNLRLGEESRAIDAAIREPDVHYFNLEQSHSVRWDDLQGLLLRYNPDIVHFSGHGSNSNQIIVEDSDGNSHPISAKALSKLFSLHKDTVRLVVLNACYSEGQANAIAENIDCVIGMSKEIGDKSAISFARSFYLALAYGKNVKFAFESGCSEIDIAGLNEEDTPQLLIKQGCDPTQIIFTTESDNKEKKNFNILTQPKTTAHQDTEEIQPKIIMQKEIPLQSPPEKTEQVGWNTQNVWQTTQNVRPASSKSNSYLMSINQRGWDRMQNGQYDQAIQCFDEVINSNPEKALILADAWNGKGTCFKTIGEIQRNTNLLYQAIKCFEQMDKAYPEGCGLLSEGLAYVSLFSIAPGPNVLNVAMQIFDKVLNGNPNDCMAWCGRGKLLLSAGVLNRDVNLIRQSIDHFNRALSINPNYVEPRNLMVQAQYVLRQMESIS
jgi:tetratricopeptide (TPR) repeat protein